MMIIMRNVTNDYDNNYDYDNEHYDNEYNKLKENYGKNNEKND